MICFNLCYTMTTTVKRRVLWCPIWTSVLCYMEIMSTSCYPFQVMFVFRPWARGVHHTTTPPPTHHTTPPPPPPPTHTHTHTHTHPYKTMGVSTLINRMLTVKTQGLTTDLQLFSKGTLKTQIPNYRVGKIFLWQLWPCNSAVYVLNDSNLVSNERWVF